MQLKGTQTKVFVAIGVAWFSGIFYQTWNISTVSFANSSCSSYVYFTSAEAQTLAGVAAIFFEFLLPLVVMVICYGRIFYLLRGLVGQVIVILLAVAYMSSAKWELDGLV